MRLQRERYFEEGDVWRIFCAADPERALRGLRADAEARHWNAQAWRDLLWVATDRDDTAFQFEIVELLADMPDAILAELLHPSASWLQRRRAILVADPIDGSRFFRMWDRLADLAYPADASPVEVQDGDLNTRALSRHYAAL